MSFHQRFLTIWAFIALLSHASREEVQEDQKEELSLIKHYELIHVNLDRYYSDKIIEFDVFNRHYVVQLILNTGLSPLVVYVHDNGTEEEMPTAHEPCYFNGREVSDDNSNVALSLCENGEDGTGIFGWIKAFNERIYIKPLSYYTVPSIVAKVTDQHLVYRSCDYDWARYPFKSNAVQIPKESANDNDDHDDGGPQPQSRRRLGYGKVEVLAVIGSGWSLSKVKSGFNEANAAYHDSSLSSSVQLTISLAKTVTKTLSCSDAKTCVSKLDNYMKSESSDPDFAIYLGYENMYKGYAWISGVCGSRNTASCVTKSTWLGTCVAHELGHNLGADHDSSDGYMMSPSIDTGERDWSSLSNSYFEGENSRWKKCLKSTDLSGDSDTGDSDTGDSDTGGSDTGGSNNDNSGDSSSCVKISDFRGSLRSLNGYWSKSGSSYKKDGSSRYTISRIEEDGTMWWAVNGDWDYGWCGKSSLASCGGDWDTENNGNGLGSFRTSGSCRNSFTINDCYDKYDERLCVGMDQNVTDVFELDYSEGCYNDEPVWRYNDSAELVFYLHFNTIDQWVITKGGMMESQHDAIYFCEMKDLFECNDDEWKTKKEKDGDMIVLETVDINVEQCGIVEEEESQNVKSNSGNIVLLVVIILLCTALVAILVVFVIHKTRTPKIKRVNVDEDSEDEEQEIVVTATGN